MQNTKDAGGTVRLKRPDVQISVQNFGPIAHADIALRPLTVFVGESNTGKTYLAALIYALHQNFEGLTRFPRLHQTIFLMTGRYRWPRGRPDIQACLEERQDVLEKLNVPGKPFKFSDLPQSLRAQLQRNLDNSESLDDPLKRCFDIESISELIRSTSGSPHNEMAATLEVREDKQTCWTFNMRNCEAETTVNGHVDENTVLLSAQELAGREILDFGEFMRLLRVYRGEIAEAYYLPAARSGIMQSHRVIARSLVKSATRVGVDRFREIPTFSGMVADFLEQIIGYEDRNGDWDEMTSIANLLEMEVLRGKIEVKRAVAEGYPEFLYRPKDTARPLRMSQSSSMVSELAPLALFLRGIVRSGDLLIIEEPESHLHPGAQTAIALTLARLVRAGVRVVVTTHSSWFLQQIANLIREGEVNRLENGMPASADWFWKEDVGAWWFHRDKPVTEIPFDLIDGIEPRDFGDVAEILYNRSVTLQEKLVKRTGERREIE